MEFVVPDERNSVLGDMASGDGTVLAINQDTPFSTVIVDEPILPGGQQYSGRPETLANITWRLDDPLRCRSNSKAHRNKRNRSIGKRELRVGVSRSDCSLPQGSGGKSTLSLSVLQPLLSCGVCRVMPIQTMTVHTCLAGHQVCGQCYSSGHARCEICQVQYDGRNEALEGVLVRLRQKCPGLFPGERQEEEPVGRIVQHSSHRPLNCPHLTCNRVVAANGFLAHFEFEHPSVPVFQMTPGYHIRFSLPAQKFQKDLPRVIAVLEVNVINSKKCRVVEKLSLTPSFSVRRDVVICALLCGRVSDYLAAWCASLFEDPLPLSYSLETRGPSGGQITYRGSMTSLHVPQDPRSILQSAQCLILAPQSQDVLPLDLKFIATKH